MTEKAAAPSLTPVVETLTVPNRRPATYEHTAFFGRIVFGMRYTTLGDDAQMRQLYEGLKTANNITDDSLLNEAANFAGWLLATSTFQLSDWHDHIELEAFHAFVTWWVNEVSKPLPDYVALWNYRLELGWSVQEAWKKAYSGAHAVSLGAPRPLLPDEKLTDKERTDPNSEPGEKKAG